MGTTAAHDLPYPDDTDRVMDGAAATQQLADAVDQALTPVGAVIPWAGTTGAAPAGWLKADGSAVSRTAEPALFAAIGTTYGAGDGSTTFNLPNLKGRIPVGLDAAQAEFDVQGETGGAKTHTLTVGEIPYHQHNQAVDSSYNAGTGTGVPTHYAMNSTGASRSVVPMATDGTGGGAAHNNLQPYIVLQYLIKR